MNYEEMDLNQIEFGSNDFADNPYSVLPSNITSGAIRFMGGDPIRQLNAGMQVLKDELIQDDLASKREEIDAIRFGPVETQHEFCSVYDFYPSELKTSGGTPMGEAINEGLDLLETRKQMYRNSGIDRITDLG